MLQLGDGSEEANQLKSSTICQLFTLWSNPDTCMECILHYYNYAHTDNYGGTYFELLIQLRVGPAIRSKGNEGAVLYDRPAGDVNVECAVSGGVDPQLLTGHHKHTVLTVIHKH